MATRKIQKTNIQPSPDADIESGVEVGYPSAEETDAGIESSLHSVDSGDESLTKTVDESAETQSDKAFAAPNTPTSATVHEGNSEAYKPRFHFFIIDSGRKSESAKVLRENFRMIREFQQNDPLYVLNREQSVALIRQHPALIGRDPVLLVHDLQAKGGSGESGYHGFRLCLGRIREGQHALAALQKFLRFIEAHRDSENIELAIREQLHRKGFEGAIEIIREGAAALTE